MRNLRLVGLLTMGMGAMAAASQLAQAQAGVVRCEVDGRTLYQAEPCDDPATESELGRGTFTVVDPHAHPARPAAGQSRQPGRRVGRAADEAADEAEALAEKKQRECDRHQRAIDRIDAQARARSTARLAERRRNHKDSLWALKCAFP